jgi:hypothetical protein
MRTLHEHTFGLLLILHDPAVRSETADSDVAGEHRPSSLSSFLPAALSYTIHPWIHILASLEVLGYLIYLNQYL